MSMRCPYLYMRDPKANSYKFQRLYLISAKSWKNNQPNHGILLHFIKLPTIIWVNRGESNEELFEENSRSDFA